MTCKSGMLIPLLLVFYCLISISSCNDDVVKPDNGSVDLDSIPSSSGKTDWWSDARFGMFIHYGIYSALGGEYIGPDMDGNLIHFQTAGRDNQGGDNVRIGNGAGAEWIMYEAGIPRKAYRTYASSFTAEKYDPQAIVNLAKKAGMKYIVITAKHHDGFCLWKTATTDWNVSNTPAGALWGDDLIAPLAKAARAAGLKFGVYFSHARDWMHVGALGQIPELFLKEYSYTENQTYMDTYTYPMISELLDRYHPDILWWDSPQCNPYAEFSEKCDRLIKHFDSKILQNDRLSTLPAYQGDFSTPEQSLDERNVTGNTELCMTMNSSWGYNKFDADWKKTEYILWCLLRANKLGGNFLLNVGPRGDGTIPEACQTILEQLGQWLETNNVAVYDTQKSPFQYNLPYGPSTWKESANRKHLYYHIFYWDGSGELWLPGIMNKTDEVKLSFLGASDLKFQVEAVDHIGLHITGLPKEAPSKLCTTLDVAFLKDATLEEGTRCINDVIHLDALGAQISDVEIRDWGVKPSIYWYRGREIFYKVHVDVAGSYKVSANLSANHDGTITYDFGNGNVLTGANTATPAGHANFSWQNMGTISLPAGIHILKITSQQSDSWLKLREFKLQRL